MKKKSSFNYDLGFFFLVAVITVSLSAFVREMNVVLSGIDADNQTAQTLLSTTYTPRHADDVAAMQSCFLKTVRENLGCVKSDLNGDGVVNFADLAILRNSIMYDLNGDGVITFNNDVSDLVAMKDCFLEAIDTRSICMRADLDRDGYVNFSDLAKLKGAFLYDVNGDKRVGGIATSGDLVVIKNCFFGKVDSTTSCASADFNKDGVVNFTDLGLFQTATDRTDYDIDQNGIVEATISGQGSDLSHFKSCIFEDTKTNTNCAEADFNGDGVINFTDLALLRSATLYDLNGDGKVSYEVNSSDSLGGTIQDFTLQDTSSQVSLGLYLSWRTSVPVNAKISLVCTPAVQLYSKEGNTTESCSATTPYVISYSANGFQAHNVASLGVVGSANPVSVVATLSTSYKPKEDPLVEEKRTKTINLLLKSNQNSPSIPTSPTVAPVVPSRPSGK